MIQVCDPPRQRQVRRLSAEEFFTLVRCGGAGFYRPRSEVLRMLTAGEAWGTAGAALLVLPLTADTAAAAALRNWLGRRQLEGAGVGAAGGQGTAGAAAGKGLCCTGQPPLRRQSCTGALSAERNGIT